MNYRRKILVVDDSAVNRMIVAKILSDSFEIIEAEDGVDALEILSREADNISLIILDIIMPIMDGYTFLENYSKIPQAGSIPVIVATQMDSEEDEVHALSAGAADFITKPYKPDVIRHRVSNIIKLRETASFINTIERDMLTSLYTKEAFYTRASSLMQHDPSNLFDIVCIDIENFRLVNDLYGETEGDKLLCAIAESLDVIVGSVGGIVGRIGGDVFVAILPVLDQLQWQEFVDEFQSKLKDNHMPANVLVKYGIYRAIDRSVSIRAMCDRALQALHSIKGKYGVTHAYYDDEMGSRRQYELELTTDMKQALGDNQFVIYYQPKYDLNTERIVGAEALARWNHPTKGLLPPSEFIPIFEANGFVTQLDFFVWESVCKSLRRWLDEDKNPLPVSVNVSRIDIYNELLPEMLLGLVQTYKIPTKLLHLEITETAYVKNQQQLVKMVNRLKKCGFTIEMDDFGSGFSSLTMLTEIPVDAIKLDMSLLENRKKSDKSTSVLRFIINLSRELGIPVIAEGVETRDDINYLKALKCKYGQGFFFSKPVPIESYERLMLSSISKEPPVNLPAGSVSELNLESVFGSLPCGVACFDAGDGCLDTCNERFSHILGCSHCSELIQARPLMENLFIPEFRSTCRDMQEKLRTKAMTSVEAFGVIPETKDGSEPLCTFMLKSVELGGKNVILALLSEFTEDYAVSPGYSDLKAVVGKMPGGIVKFSADDYHIDFVSNSFSDLTGYSGDEAVEKFEGRFDKLIFRADREYTLSSMAEQLNSDSEALCEHRIELADGALDWFFSDIRLTKDGAGNRWCYAVINKRGDDSTHIHHNYHTHIDHLTGLLDNKAFETAAEERLAEAGENCVLITLDLDNFSLVNENFGHKHCDELLRAVAEFLRKEFRGDDIIARIGSDEFAVLVYNTSQPSGVFPRMSGICKRMIAQIGVSCSMGVAVGSAECTGYEALFSQAVRAMREVKSTRKNGCALYGGESD